MYKGGSHSTHVHSPENHLSGNFYVQAEPNSSNIVFTRDMHGDLMHFIKKKKHTKETYYSRAHILENILLINHLKNIVVIVKYVN